jgi:hypothetical protein
VPVERVALGQLDPCLIALGIEQAELDALGIFREEREVRAAAVPFRAEREEIAGPYVHPTADRYRPAA